MARPLSRLCVPSGHLLCLMLVTSWEHGHHSCHLHGAENTLVCICFSQEKYFLRNKTLGCQLVFLAWLFYLSSSHYHPAPFKCVRIRCVVQVPRGPKSRNSWAPTKGEAPREGLLSPVAPHCPSPPVQLCPEGLRAPRGGRGELSAQRLQHPPCPQALSRALCAHSWPRPPSLRPGVPTLVQCEVPGHVLFWT